MVPSAGPPPARRGGTRRCISLVASSRWSIPSGGSHTAVFPPPVPAFPAQPRSPRPVAPHRRGGFLSCTVSMSLRAAAQTRSLPHLPRDLPEPAPKTLPHFRFPPLPEAARVAGRGRGREHCAWVTWDEACVTWCAKALGTTELRRFLQAVSSAGLRAAPAAVSLRLCKPRTLGLQAGNPSLRLIGDTEVSCQAPA